MLHCSVDAGCRLLLLVFVDAAADRLLAFDRAVLIIFTSIGFLRRAALKPPASMAFLLFIAQVLAVCIMGVIRGPGSGVIEINRTLSCCKELKINYTKDCYNTFEIGQKTLAWVQGNVVLVEKPFQHLAAEGVMQVLDCVDFTHRSICTVGARELETRIYYHLTPCSKDEATAATDIQGFLLFVLLIVALMMMMIVF